MCVRRHILSSSTLFTPRRPQTNGIAEGAVGEWWHQAMECYPHLRNVHDTMSMEDGL